MNKLTQQRFRCKQTRREIVNNQSVLIWENMHGSHGCFDLSGTLQPNKASGRCDETIASVQHNRERGNRYWLYVRLNMDHGNEAQNLKLYVQYVPVIPLSRSSAAFPERCSAASIVLLSQGSQVNLVLLRATLLLSDGIDGLFCEPERWRGCVKTLQVCVSGKQVDKLLRRTDRVSSV